MAVNTNPTLRSPERAFALQKYLLLHSENDALQKHLNEISSTTEASSSSDFFNPRSRNPSLSSIASSTSSSSSPPTSTSSHFRSFSHSSSISPISEDEEKSFQCTSPTRPALGRSRRSSLPAPRSEFELHMAEIESDEQKLLNVNQQIKTVLTELLNCESVKGDRSYRMWVQVKLMEAERELKGCRSRSGRRRSSSVDIGGETDV